MSRYISHFPSRPAYHQYASIAVPAGTGWQIVGLGELDLPAGPGAVTLRALDCSDCEVAELVFTPR